MAIEIFVGDTRRLVDETSGADEIQIRMHEDLYMAFITEVHVRHPRHMMFPIDSFYFLHKMLRQMYLLQSSSSVEIDIGEGLYLGGKIEDDVIAAEFLVHDKAVSRWNTSIAQFLIFVSMLISELIQSIRKIDVNVDNYVRRFPPALF